MSRQDVGNWVNRGQPPEPELTRLLAVYLEKDVVTGGATLRPYVTALREMAEAGTSDAQLAGYLKHVDQEVGRPQETGRVGQLAATALGHMPRRASIRSAGWGSRLTAVDSLWPS